MAITASQIQQLYLVYFGRPADPNSLAFWLANPSATLETIARQFAATPAYQARIAGKDFAQIVNGFYLNLFNRNAEPAGLSFWVSLLNQGKLTTELVGLIISNAALAQPATSVDTIALSAKLTAAANFTAEVSKSTAGFLAYSAQAGLDAGVNFLRPVSTPATIPSAAATTAAVDALIALSSGGRSLIASDSSGGGSPFKLSTLQDIFTDSQGVLRLDDGTVYATPGFRFSSANESVIANPGTLQPNDTLIDPSTLDYDSLTFVLGSSTTLDKFNVLDTGEITNIENLNFIFGSGAAGTPAGTTFLSGITGVNTITATGALADSQQFFNFSGSGATTFDGSGVTGDGTNVLGLDVRAGASIADVTISGSAINDTLRGGDFNDVISGGAGIDVILPSLGNDTVTGGTGSDSLIMIGGNNRVVYQSNLDGYDIISGFVGSSQIALSSSGFAGAPAAGTVAILGNAIAIAISGIPASGANFPVGNDDTLAGMFNSASANRFFIQTNPNPLRSIRANTLIYDADGDFTTTSDQNLIASGIGTAVSSSIVFI